MELGRVHAADYCARVAEVESAGGGMLDPDTWVSPGSNLAAQLAAGAGIEAVSFVLEAPERRALCLVRPPGHHALPSAGMGFCIYANIAVAAAEALARFELNRVLIVDFDVHHGNGTQEVFYASERVGVSFDPPLSVLSRNRCARRDRHGPGLRPHREYPAALRDAA